MSQLESYTSEEIIPVDNRSAVLNSKLKTLIMDIIHMISIVTLLIEKGVKDIKAWEWQKQLKYKLDAGKCRVQMCDAGMLF